MIPYRGYEIGVGEQGNVGIFAFGYQTSTALTVEIAQARIDRWHAEWCAMVQAGHPDAEDAYQARRTAGVV